MCLLRDLCDHAYMGPGACYVIVLFQQLSINLGNHMKP